MGFVLGKRKGDVVTLSILLCGIPHSHSLSLVSKGMSSLNIPVKLFHYQEAVFLLFFLPLFI